MEAEWDAFLAQIETLKHGNGLVVAFALHETGFLAGNMSCQDRVFAIEIMLRLERLDLSLPGSLDAALRLTDGIRRAREATVLLHELIMGNYVPTNLPLLSRDRIPWQDDELRAIASMRLSSTPWQQIGATLRRSGDACRVKWGETANFLRSWLEHISTVLAKEQVASDLVTSADAESSSDDEESAEGEEDCAEAEEVTTTARDLSLPSLPDRENKTRDTTVCRFARRRRREQAKERGFRLREGRRLKMEEAQQQREETLQGDSREADEDGGGSGPEEEEEEGHEAGAEAGQSQMSPIVENSIMNAVLVDAWKNAHVRRRPVYSDESRAFWMVISMYDDRCRRYLRGLIGGPTKSSVQRWMTDSSVDTSAFYDRSRAVDNVEMWIERFEIPRGTVFSLSCDAAKCDEDLVIGEDFVEGVVGELKVHDAKKYFNHAEYQKLWNDLLHKKQLISHVFVFMMSPLSMKKAFPVYIEFTNTGSANDSIQESISAIIESCNERGIDVRFFGSDSDPKYRHNFDTQFRSYNDNLIAASLIPSPDMIQELPFYTADVPHILKRCRTRLVQHEELFLLPQPVKGPKPWFAVTSERILRSPNVPSCVFRKGSLPSMDDYYPAKLFNWKVMRDLFPYRHGFVDTIDNLVLFLFLFIPTCARECFFNKSLNRNQRCIIAMHGLVATEYVYHQQEICKEHANSHRGFHNKNFLFSAHICIDLCNAFMSLIIILTTVESAMPLSHLGSTVDEHEFARTRYDAGNAQTAASLRASFDKHILLDWLSSKGSVLRQHHSRTFSTAITERGLAVIDESMKNQVTNFSRWLAIRFRNMGLAWGDTVWGRYVNTILSYDDIEITKAAAISAKAMVHGWKLEYSLYKKREVHASENRCAPRTGRNIAARYRTGAREDPQ